MLHRVSKRSLRQLLSLWLVLGWLVALAVASGQLAEATENQTAPEPPELHVVLWMTRTQLKLLGAGPYALAKDVEIINDLPGVARHYPLRLALPAYAEIEWDEHMVKRVRLVQPYRGSVAE